MIKKLFFIFYFFIACIFPVHASNKDIKDKFITDFFEKYSEAIKICNDYAKNRNPPSQKYVKLISKLPQDELRGFLVYKSIMATNKCIEIQSGYPVSLLVYAIGDDDASIYTKGTLLSMIKILSTKSALNSFYIYNSISLKKRQELNKINYFDLPFDMVKVFYLIKNQ